MASLAACSGGGNGAIPSTQSNVPPITTLSTSTSDAYATAVMNDGPTAYYRLDDTGSTAHDATVNGLSGTVGSYVSEGAAGLLKSSTDTAMSFKGSSASGADVTVAANSKLQPASAVSVEALLRFSSTQTRFAAPVAYGGDSNANYAPYEIFFNNGHICAQFHTTGGVLTICSSSTLNTNTTYHVVATFNGSTGDVYVNGNLAASGTKTGSLTGYRYGLGIGDDAGHTDPAFNGTIDDVAIYAGKALSAAQVSSHYQAAISTAAPAPTATAPPTTTSTTTTSYGTTVLNDGPTAYYHLDDTGSTARDASGNALSGTVGSYVTEGSASLVSASSDASMTFKGSSASGADIRVASNAKLQPSNAVSVEALLRFSTAQTRFAAPVAYGADSNANYAPYEIFFNNGHICAQFHTTGGVLTLCSSSTLNTNTTYHVVATFNGSTGDVYVDGKLAASGTKTGSLTGYRYGLGIGDDAGHTDPAFNGELDEVAIYAGKALSATQVAAHYQAATGTSSTTGSSTPAPAPTAPPTTAPTTAPTASPVPVAATGGYVYHGCNIYPAGDAYVNTDISNATPSPSSASIIAKMPTGNFDYGDDAHGEAVNLATNSTTKYTVQAISGGHNPPMSNGAGTQAPWMNGFYIEGTIGQNSDGHAQVLNTSGAPNCVETELTETKWSGSSLGAFAGFNVQLSNSYSSQMPLFTSDSVAMIPMLGFTDYGEDASLSSINHPLSFFMPASAGSVISKYGYYAPAKTGYVSIGSCTGSSACIHLGDYIRLKASFNCGAYTRIGQLVCNQLKHYGAVFNDDASSLGFRFGLTTSGANPWGYSTNLQPLLQSLHMSDFDIIEHGSLKCSGSPCV